MRRARMTRSQWGIRDQDYGVSPSCGVASKHQNGHEQVLGTYPNQVRWARIQNCVQKSCTPDDLLEIAQHQIGTSQACRGSHWGLYFLVGTRLQWRTPPPNSIFFFCPFSLSLLVRRYEVLTYCALEQERVILCVSPCDGPIYTWAARGRTRYGRIRRGAGNLSESGECPVPGHTRLHNSCQENGGQGPNPRRFLPGNDELTLLRWTLKLPRSR